MNGTSSSPPGPGCAERVKWALSHSKHFATVDPCFAADMLKISGCSDECDTCIKHQAGCGVTTTPPPPTTTTTNKCNTMCIRNGTAATCIERVHNLSVTYTKDWGNPCNAAVALVRRECYEECVPCTSACESMSHERMTIYQQYDVKDRVQDSHLDVFLSVGFLAFLASGFALATWARKRANADGAPPSRADGEAATLRLHADEEEEEHDGDA